MVKKNGKQKVAEQKLIELNEQYSKQGLTLKEIKQTRKQMKYWVNQLDLHGEKYFEYKDDIDAKNVNAGEDMFSDISWNAFYEMVNEETHTDPKNFGVDEIYYQENDYLEGYVMSVGKVSNGMIEILEIQETKNKEFPFSGRLTILH
jgi:hypothetical protein